ncbi:sensor histidine kinase [Subtercola endophyticus]|uniref:sensor histidine kinase n=1 Tax=Subtercola endophyticus TaxID=2895559 RepID=UPI001E38F746|nr:sensor histidine kinase [Subtercola endophyticus]UFS59309.1 sensor histidine kinase [Subtercola endophyticus]
MSAGSEATRDGGFDEMDARAGGRRWYLGSTVGLIWLAFPISVLWTNGLPLALEIVGQVLLVAWAAIYVLLPPRLWGAPLSRKILYTGAYFVTTLVFLPFMGVGVTSLWVFVAITFAMSAPPTRIVALVVGVIAVFSFVLISSATGDPSNAFWLPLITFSIAMMMSAFARQLELVRRLRDAQAETARLAVEQERSRVARDLHDILGHSLTVITVKAELAGRLLPEHPERAGVEVDDIERLARGALADVRSTVTGYRGVNLAAELSGARIALNSAGIQADLPNTVDAVPTDTSQVFAWVVREGVTNVIRHSGAARCTIVLEPHCVEIVDDGRGTGCDPAAEPLSRGNGLAGLRERVAAVGGSLSAGPGAGGGFVLRVTA